jgi:hypothetical protein
VTPAPPRPGQDHILIAGPGKTGTTGVFASVKAGLTAAGIEARSIFEPTNTRKLDNLLCLAPELPILVKTTLDTQEKAVPEPRIFDRIVMTARDPRDMVLSSLLFRPMTVAALERINQGVVDKFIAALEAKQADPASISVRQLFELADELNIGKSPFDSMIKIQHRQQAFLAKHAGYVMQYEQFVQGELGGLSEYLGFPVENVSASSSSMFGFITRSKGSGEFRQWFTADDLQYFNEMFHEFLVKFDYDLDVELPADPAIDPSTGSEYVRRGYAERTKNRGDIITARSTAWAPADVASMADLQHLIDYGIDGDAMACARVAEVLLSGHLGPEAGNTDDALRWARAGAQLGGLPAMQLVQKLLRDKAARSDHDAELYREARRWRIEATRRGTRRSPEDRTRIKRLEQELRKARRRATPAAARPVVATGLAARINEVLTKSGSRAALGRVKRRVEAKVRARGAAR